ncbi:MAG TPA: pyrroline-5-carboxylate reductase [Candidatus Cybelea sp.]|jgi:pyrroline-5-carboxylate reductase
MIEIGIVGLGTIGRALAQGFQKSPRVGRIAATTRRSRTQGPELPGVIAMADNRELAAESDVIALCVKPHQMEGVVRDIADTLREGALLVSVAAGISTKAIADWTGGRFPVVRAMPNMPCHIGAGITALAAGPAATDEHLELLRELFEGLGRVVVVEESLMNAVTALSGCGPAYVYVIVEALTDAGVSLGLPRNIARELSAQTLQGSAAYVLASGKHPAALKDDVTTPAGCTIDGLLALEEGRLRSTLARAVAAAASRASKLAPNEV